MPVARYRPPPGGHDNLTGRPASPAQKEMLRSLGYRFGPAGKDTPMSSTYASRQIDRLKASGARPSGYQKPTEYAPYRPLTDFTPSELRAELNSPGLTQMRGEALQRELNRRTLSTPSTPAPRASTPTASRTSPT